MQPDITVLIKARVNHRPDVDSNTKQLPHSPAHDIEKKVNNDFSAKFSKYASESLHLHSKLRYQTIHVRNWQINLKPVLEFDGTANQAGIDVKMSRLKQVSQTNVDLRPLVLKNTLNASSKQPATA